MSDDAWSSADVARLRELWADETLSAAEIGRRLGRGKGSVVGKAHRLDLPGRASPIRRDVSNPAAPRRPRTGKWSIPLRVATLPPVLAEAVAAPAPVEPPPPRASGACCWPEGDPKKPGFHFCGAPRQRRWDGSERPYCAAHAARAYRAPGEEA